MRLTKLFVVVLTGAISGAVSGPIMASDAEKGEDRHHVSEAYHHAGHSDQLLLLLNHKISLQKLQNTFPEPLEQQSRNLAQQKHLLDLALPVLNAYLQIPADRYPNTTLYEQSLHNRSAMLQDYSQIVTQFYQQLIGG